MFFFRKIYWHNKPLILTNNLTQLFSEIPITKGYQHYRGAFRRNFRESLRHIDQPGSMGAVIEDMDPQALVTTLEGMYTPVPAGGGVVYNEQEDVLMIFRRGRWDLPKGKIDEGEEMSEGALREVKEETGLIQVTLQHQIGHTFHLYEERGQELMKCTTWYHMLGTAKEKPVPQAEENILRAEWVPQSQLPFKLKKSFEAIREILLEAGCHTV